NDIITQKTTTWRHQQRQDLKLKSTPGMDMGLRRGLVNSAAPAMLYQEQHQHLAQPAAHPSMSQTGDYA
ncbi:hypothetical protein EDD11_007954, partial [Mortierella claussenii]